MTSALIKYDAACRAIAEARTADEAKGIRDQAEAMRVYARQAKNKDLEIDAAEIRIRAERRLGELIKAQKESVGLNTGSRGQLKGRDASGGAVREPPETDERPTLAEAGIDKKLSSRAQKMAAVPEAEFEDKLGGWRARVGKETERVTVDLLKAGEKARGERRENDAYYTPRSIVDEIARRWKPRARLILEPCCGDDRLAEALRAAGHDVVSADIARGQDFFSLQALPADDVALCTNPPFDRVREFIEHAFALGVTEMCLVLAERLWACGEGGRQFERHRPAIWANMDWREDYLGRGGSADRALAVAIWTSPCAPRCDYHIWSRGGAIHTQEARSAAQPRDREDKQAHGPSESLTGRIARLFGGAGGDVEPVIDPDTIEVIGVDRAAGGDTTVRAEIDQATGDITVVEAETRPVPPPVEVEEPEQEARRPQADREEEPVIPAFLRRKE